MPDDFSPNVAAIAGNIPIALLPVPYKIDATATKGAGRIGVHVFSRPR